MFQAYLSELNDYAAKTRHKTNQIPLLIDKLTEKNDVKKFFSGLHDLLEYLPNKWVPVHEISPQLVNRIINLDNRFKLPHFEVSRFHNFLGYRNRKKYFGFQFKFSCFSYIVRKSLN